MTVTLEQIKHDVEGIFEKLMAKANVTRETIESNANNGKLQPSVFDIDAIERNLLDEALRLAMSLMLGYLERVGPGDVGLMTEFDGKQYKRHTSLSSREFHTVFGKLRYDFQKYYCCDSEVTGHFGPMRSVLNFPERRASYFAQDLISCLAVERPFE